MKINGSGESEKTNPIQSQFPKGQNERNCFYNKGLQKKRRFHSPKKQSQFKPNFRKAKMNVNLYVIKEYENKHSFLRTSDVLTCPAGLENMGLVNIDMHFHNVIYV